MTPSPKEAGVAGEEEAGEGCPNCEAPLEEGAVLCVACGYNTQTGAVMGAAPDQPKKQKAEKKKAASAKKKGEPSFKFGYLGAAIGGVVALAGWTTSMVVTGYSIGWLAWLSGAVVGVVARLCAPYCAHKLGVAAAISAFLAITLGQGLAGFIIFKKEVASADFKEWA